ncbi:MAG: hypothetical protein IKM08_07670 [Clostridia bacterium]|nr:hypothetical protein [Clostridia bacterium]
MRDITGNPVVQIVNILFRLIYIHHVQPTHHGANGGSTDLNTVIDPDICLWTVDAWRFHTDGRMLGFQRGYEYNWVLRNDEFKVRQHYHNSEDTEIFMDEK